MNPVEIFVGITTREAIRRDVFAGRSAGGMPVSRAYR